MKTIKQIQDWMWEECFNDYSYFIGEEQPVGVEGFGLRFDGFKYIFFYTERRQRDVVKEFSSEDEACEYVYQQMKNDKWARTHMIGFLKSKDKTWALCQELDAMGIEYSMDSIPYGGINDPRYRVFVFGCDEKKTRLIKDKYKE